MMSPAVASIISTPASTLHIHKRIKDAQHHDMSPAIASSISSITLSIDDFKPETKFGKFGGFIALIGGCLLQLTLGSLFCYGNLVPYIASYLTYNDYIQSSDQDTFDLTTSYNNNVSQTNLVLFIIIFCMSIFVIFGGNVEVKIGPTKTIIIASLSVTLGFGLTYFSLIYNSIWLIIITYGIIFGCGVGIGYPVLFIVCMRWFPAKRGIFPYFRQYLNIHNFLFVVQLI